MSKNKNKSIIIDALNNNPLTHTTMNDTTLFLAQIMGPTLAAFGLGIIFSPKHYSDIYKNMEKAALTLMFMTMTMIVAGMAVVLKHFMWGSFAEIVVTVVGLAMLIKGIMFAIMPNTLLKLTKTVVSNGLIQFGGILWLLGGGYLCWVGFLA